MSEQSPPFAPRVLRRDESGFTVLELLIVMALFSLVMAVVGAGVVSITTATRSTDERSRANTELRNAVEALARDIRAANPIDAQTPVSVYDTQISFEIYCTPVGGTCNADNLRQKVYRLAANRLELSVGGGAFRTVLGPSLTSQLPITQRQYAIVNTPTQPVFTYLRDDGSAIPTGVGTPGTPASPARFRDCTQAVRIHLRMITEPGNTLAPADLTTTVTLRNFNEVSNCATATPTTV